MKTVVALRVDRTGHAVAASAEGRAWMTEAGTSLCHRLVEAKSLDGKPVCNPNCAAALANGRHRGHLATQVVVRGEAARLDCHRLLGAAVVVIERTDQVASLPDDPT